MYLAYDLARVMVQPLNLWAGAVQAALAGPPLDEARVLAPLRASTELLERATRRYPKPSFGIDCVDVGGAPVRVGESVTSESPFCRLVHFEREGDAAPGPKLLVVAPLSGHHATLVRETLLEMIPAHDVYVTDWVDARLVPWREGPFGLHDYVDLVRRFLRELGGGAHVLAVCQPCVPVLAAVASLAAEGSPAQPASMTLISGPVDPRVSPTAVNRFAAEHSLRWLDATLIHRVPPPAPGFGRRVYPGALQLSAFMGLDLARHVEAHVDHFVNVLRGLHDAADKHRRFYDEYFAVMDLPAEFYLETVSEVFQEHLLPRGLMVHRGVRVDPSAIERTALFTVEGENDDITGLGQTEAGHRLCSRIPGSMRRHHVQAGAGHYGTFSGRRFREEIAPLVRAFVRDHDVAG